MLNKRQTAAFCSRLRLLLAAGLPLLEAMRVIEALPQNTRQRTEWRAVIEQLNSGRSLSAASAGLLPAMARGSLAAAERAGNLEENLGRLAGYYAEKAELDEKLAAALVYPVFVLVLSLISVMVMVMFVLPGMRSLLADLETELPPVTSFILGLSDACSSLWPALVILPPALAAVFYRLRGKDRSAIERVVLRAPVISKLYLQEQVIQVFGTLGALLQGGAPIIEAVEIARASTQSPAMKQILSEAGAAVSSGEKLSTLLSRYRHFPGSVLQMLKVGEKSGQLDRMLTEIAGFQAREREAALKRFIALIEPCLTLTVGLVVGLIVLGMFLPLVNLVSSLQ